MKPVFKIMVGNTDITATIRPFFISLSLRDDVGLAADTLDIELSEQDNRGNTLAWPPRGRVLKVWIGYEGEKLHYKGAFTVDELSYDVAEQVLSIHAKATDLLEGQAKVLSTVTYCNTTLRDVLRILAARNGWTLAISAGFVNKPVTYLAQADESDLNLLTRLGRLYGGIAQVKNGHLLFTETGSMKTASGRDMPSFLVSLSDLGPGAQYQELGRDYYTGVSAHYSGDQGSGTITLGTDTVLHVLREVYESKDQATDAAKAELKRIKGQNNTLSLPFVHGRPEMVAEAQIQLDVTFPAVIRMQPWVVSGVTHTLADGLSTSVDCVYPSTLEDTDS